MASNPIQALNDFGQSVWLDNINRTMITSGGLKDRIAEGLRGMTSNPSIFEKAICKSSDYDAEIEKIRGKGKSVFEVYDHLTVRDIQDACDLFRGVHEATSGLDGYVSLEINPKLALKTQETIDEGKRLHERVDRDNLMLKVPATEEGFPAVEDLTAAGVNVNVTLIFSVGQYAKTAEAYLRGVKRYIADGGDARSVASVASVFVSRVDSAVDKMLDARAAQAGDESARKEAQSLRGKAACANAALIYKRYLDILYSDSFKHIAADGARVQRVLWGSTSTKDPAYSDIKYVTELIGKGTVNTLPDATYKAFMDHGVVEEALTPDVTEPRQIMRRLAEAGISIDSVCARLLDDGVVQFETAFDSLLASIGEKLA
jgi:transaldolase